MRLFAALRFPDPFCAALAECQRDLKRLLPSDGIRWTKPGNLHLTLAFLGERADWRPTAEVLGSVRVDPVRVVPSEFRKFGDVLVLGLKNGEPVVRLAGEVRAALDDAGIAYDKKPPVPHITLARGVRTPLPDGVSLLVPRESTLVASFSLMKSEGGGASLVYTELWNSRR